MRTHLPLPAAGVGIALAVFLATTPGPAAADFQVPHPKSKTLANGLVVHVFEDHDLPTVYYRLLVRAGSSRESAGKAGLASLTTQAMRQGTESLSAKEMAKKIDFVGGYLSADADYDFSFASAQSRTPDRQIALDLLADMVLHPAFAPEEVARMKSQTQASIRQSRDDASTVADEHALALIHGRHPYGRPVSGDEQSVAGLSRDDVTDFHKTYWRPNNAVLAIAGDVKAEDEFAAAEKAFGSWEKAEIPPLIPIQSPELTANRLRILDKPDLTQAQIRIGSIGLPSRSSPDYFPAIVMNYVLGGGGFASRLESEVRAKSGLTYDVSTGFTNGVDPGTFLISTFTKNESVKATIDAVLDVVRRYREQGPTADELEKAKAYYVGTFPFGFQGPGEVARQWLRAEFYGLGDDYFDQYRARVRAVTAADVKRVAQTYLRTEPLVFVVAGKGADVAPQLTSYGKADTLPFIAPTGVIPEVAPVAPPVSAPASPESRKQAAAIVDRALRAHGGLAAFQAVRDWKSQGKLALSMGEMNLEGEFAEIVQMPSRRRMEMTVMGQQMVQIMDGNDAWAISGGQAEKMPPDQAEAMRVGSYSNPMRLLLALSDAQADIRYGGRESVNGKPAEVVEWAREGGRPARVFFDSASNLLVQLEQIELSPTGSTWVPVQRVYSDYKTVGKIRYPHKITVYANGTKAVEQTLAHVYLNAGVPPNLFQRPR